MSDAFVLQSPDENLTHSVEWAAWLGGDTISSETWTIEPSGPTVVDLNASGTVSSARVSDLTLGQIYSLSCLMVSSGGETGMQSIIIRCGEK